MFYQEIASDKELLFHLFKPEAHIFEIIVEFNLFIELRSKDIWVFFTPVIRLANLFFL